MTKGFKNMKFKRFIAAFMVAALISPQAFAERSEESDYFDLMLSHAANLYIDDSITEDDLVRAAIEKILKENPDAMYEMIKGAFESLDDYSDYYTAEEYDKYYRALNKVFYGMGAVVQRRGGDFVILRVYDDGGAMAAGIEKGDKIREVDGKSTEGMSLEEVVDAVSGEEGTFVNVKLERGGELLSFDIERKKVNEETVAHSILPGDIGYVEILSFAEMTPYEVKDALYDFDAAGVDKVILDLRDNPGGVLTSVVSVAQLIVPEGIITQTIYRDEDKNEIFYSSLKEPKFKFTVLVNEETASAAEVLTGALKDSGSYVIGRTTFGKGVIQNVYNLKNGDAFKITTGHYLTRNGSDINKVGIEPDEVVLNSTRPITLSRYEEFENGVKWRVGDSGNGVLAAKQRLAALGYYNGEEDEYFDEYLEQAVYAFQEKAGLYPYGVLDFSTQATMQNEFCKLEEVVDDQLITAYEYLGGNAADLE